MGLSPSRIKVRRSFHRNLPWRFWVLLAGALSAASLPGCSSSTGPDRDSTISLCGDAPGTICTWAGTGEAGWDGDGGPATQARIFAPAGQAAPPTSRIALDPQGNLFLADTFNNRVRRVELDGIISTVAGSGVFPPQATAAEGVPALEVWLYWPCDVALDAEGNLFIADTHNHRIRVVYR
jgi:sugar lactone lactonase YvrE